MTREEGAAVIEAILFTMGDSVSVASICNATDQDLKDVRDEISYLKEKYEKSDSGIGLIELEDSIQLCTKSEMYEYLIKVAKTPKKITLTDALMETLSIIAYKQPITRLDVERIRGVNSDHAVNRLVEFNLVQELGRLDAPGRPLLFGTTEQFLRSFGVKSLEELPSLDAVRVEEFKQEAEQEISVKLDI
ncbi:SMC-Scp complex subunit ScpB [Butyrivibrio sp. INlla16]|uniref:SMC-Scp complex subunit ScpB n=1 Tax=Butyrivibrio sp. INlla16 TaxID=1520807 RepID=UPI0008901431|nr:SMC-Scp complex subunit ScpB [Butyrivibrio sp. INlla16]SDB17723.1 segregation and condensation protein B [Butyrivibrio sp. INlla16]